MQIWHFLFAHFVLLADGRRHRQSATLTEDLKKRGKHAHSGAARAKHHDPRAAQAVAALPPVAAAPSGEDLAAVDAAAPQSSFFERGARDEDVDSRIREVAARNSGQEPLGPRAAARQDPEDVASSLAETGAERRFGRRSRFGRRADRQGSRRARHRVNQDMAQRYEEAFRQSNHAYDTPPSEPRRDSAASFASPDRAEIQTDRREDWTGERDEERGRDRHTQDDRRVPEDYAATDGRAQMDGRGEDESATDERRKQDDYGRNDRRENDLSDQQNDHADTNDRRAEKDSSDRRGQKDYAGTDDRRSDSDSSERRGEKDYEGKNDRRGQNDRDSDRDSDRGNDRNSDRGNDRGSDDFYSEDERRSSLVNDEDVSVLTDARRPTRSSPRVNEEDDDPLPPPEDDDDVPLPPPREDDDEVGRPRGRSSKRDRRSSVVDVSPRAEIAEMDDDRAPRRYEEPERLARGQPGSRHAEARRGDRRKRRAPIDEDEDADWVQNRDYPTLQTSLDMKAGYSEASDLVWYALRTLVAVIFCFCCALLVTMATLYVEDGGKHRLGDVFASAKAEREREREYVSTSGRK